MLVLSRKKSESIVLRIPPSDTETVVSLLVVDIRSHSVRLGTEAPRRVVIHREEIDATIHGEGES